MSASTEKNLSSASEPLSTVPAIEGDWICSDSECKNVNFGRRTQCNKCQKERSVEKPGGLVKKKLGTEIGKAAAEKSRGLFSAEDWQCSKCANVNWARRQTCNMCNAPKFCDVEERTGYGGGYNDRGVVEYKDRSDSDSEFDEFGRRKKKISNKSADFKTTVDGEEKEEEYTDEENDKEDEEDDDEDDGDGDLSKYDLWGDDEVVAASKKAFKKDKNITVPSPKSQPKRDSSTPSSRSDRSKSASSSYSSSSANSKSHNRPPKKRSSHSSRSRSKSRSKSPSKDTHLSRKSRHGNSHSSLSSSHGNTRENKRRPSLRSKTRSRSPRSRSSSRHRRYADMSHKNKRNNSSPGSVSQITSSRYRRRSHSRSLSSDKKRNQK